MATPDIRTILDPLPVDRSVKADVWDAYHAVAGKDDFKARFDSLDIPREAKAALWDAKFSGEPVAPSGPLKYGPETPKFIPQGPQPVPVIPNSGGMTSLPGVPGMQAAVEPVSKWEPVKTAAKEAVFGHAIQSLPGTEEERQQRTLTYSYDAASNAMGGFLSRVFGKDRPGTVRGAAEANLKMVNELVRGIPEMVDFMFTPAGAATFKLQAARPVIRAAVNAAFATDMGQNALTEIEAARQNPTPENTGRAAKATVMAVLPFLHGAQQELQTRKVGKLIKDHRTEPVELPPEKPWEPSYQPSEPPVLWQDLQRQRRSTRALPTLDELVAEMEGNNTGAQSVQPTEVPPAILASIPPEKPKSSVAALPPVPTAVKTTVPEAPAARISAPDTSARVTGPPAAETVVAPQKPPTATGKPDLQVPTSTPSTPPPQKEVIQPAVEPKAGEGAAALPGNIAEMSPQEILADPVRFQFKRDTGGKAGVGEELKGVEKWNPELGGIMTVWRDPADGQTYVVNGHHRLDLARRLGAEKVLVRYIDAADAKAARAKGALQNIAEGRGTSIDAAKFMRDTGIAPEDMAREGVSLKGAVAREGMALSRLPEQLFDQVISGDITPRRAAILGENLENPADMMAAADLLWKAEKKGKRLTDSEVKELVRRVQGAERKVETTTNLFGEEEFVQNLALEEAQVSDYVRQRLSKEKKLFATAGSESAAQQLGAVGNVIDAAKNRQVSEAAGQALAVYDKLSLSAGPISDAVREGARRLAEGEPEAKVREEVYGRVREAVQSLIGGREAVDAPRVEAVAAGGGSAGAAGGNGGFGGLFDLDRLDAEGREGIRQHGLRNEGSFWSSESGTQASPELAIAYLKVGIAKIGRGVTDFAQWSADMVREFGEDIRPHLQRLYQDARNGFATLKDLSADDYFNFDRVNISPEAKRELQGRVIETVIRTGRFPKERETWAELRDRAAQMGPEVVKELESYQKAQPEYRAVQVIAREQVNAQNQAIYDARLKLESEAGSLTADQLLERERQIDAMEADARGLADTFMRMRSENGRNLAAYRMAVDDTVSATGQVDLTYWLSKAKRAMGLPANTTLPDGPYQKVAQAVAANNDAVKTVINEVRNGNGAGGGNGTGNGAGPGGGSGTGKGTGSGNGTGGSLAPVPRITGAATRGAPDLPGAMPSTEHLTGPFQKVNGKQAELLPPVPGAEAEHLTGPMRDATGRQADLPGAMPTVDPLTGEVRTLSGEQTAIPGVDDLPTNRGPRIERAVKSAVSRINQRAENIRTGKDPASRPGALTEEERAIVDNDPRVIAARRRLAQVMAEFHKTGFLEAVSAFRKAGLLTGVKTHLRNVGGNAVFQAMEEATRLPAGAADMALSLFTGTRTVQGMQPKAFAHATYYAATKGVHDAVEIWKHGATNDQLAKMVDIPREVNVDMGSGRIARTASQVFNTYVNHVFRSMSAEDRIFKAYAMQRSLQEQAWLISKRTGQSYSELLNHPTESMQVQAVSDAEFATFNNKNMLASKLRQAQYGLANEGAAGKAAAFAIDIAIPFANTPANIMARMIDYTPFGLIRGGHAAYKAAVDGALSPAAQRTVSLSIGRGMTGTALLFMGWKLAEAGFATGMRESDPSERNVQEAAGQQPGSVKVGGRWYQVAPFSPLGNLIVLGATLFHDQQKGPSAVAAGAGRTVLEQPMLKGVNDVLESLKSPDRSAKGVVSSIAGSFVPTALSDVAGATDTVRRSAKPQSAAEATYKGILARVPGARQTLPARYDVLGHLMTTELSDAIDPTLSSMDKTAGDPVLRELVANGARIGNPEPHKYDTPMTPQEKMELRKAGKPIPKVDEAPEEYQMRSVLTGRLIELRVGELVKTRMYQKLIPGDDRRRMLERAVDAARADASVVTTRNGKYLKADIEGRLKILQDRIRIVDRKIQQRSTSANSLPPVPGMAPKTSAPVGVQ